MFLLTRILAVVFICPSMAVPRWIVPCCPPGESEDSSELCCVMGETSAAAERHLDDTCCDEDDCERPILPDESSKQTHGCVGCMAPCCLKAPIPPATQTGVFTELPPHLVWIIIDRQPQGTFIDGIFRPPRA
jgi:hypothetical protein